MARARRTFRYTENGPEGLLVNKKAYVVVSRGGYFAGSSPARALDFQEPYIRGMLNFLGLTDVTLIQVEGQAVGPDAASQGVAAARATVISVLAKAA